MKKLIGILTASLILLFTFSVAWAKSYQPIGGSDLKNVKIAEIPDDAVFPSWVLKLAEERDMWIGYPGDPQDEVTADGCLVIIYRYWDPEFNHLDAEGREMCPFGEAFKIEKGADGTDIIHLIMILFISDDLQTEMYFDKDSWTGPARDKLEKLSNDTILNEFPFWESIKKVP